MDWTLEYAWLVPALPLLSAVIIAAFGKLMPGKGSELGVLSLALAFLLSVGIAWETFTAPAPMEPVERAFEWSPLGGGFVIELGMLVDGLTAMMFLLVTLVSLMVHIYSREYMQGEPRFTFFFTMLSLFTFSMLLLVIANNTLQALIGWELVGLCSFLLIGFYWEKKSNQDAANKAFLVTKFGDVGLIVGIIVLSVPLFGADASPFNIQQLNAAAAAGDIGHGTIALGMLLIFLACVSKSGQMPLHVWLPDAMAGPTPVSALIHAATMVTAGIFLLARLYPVMAQSLLVMSVIAVVGVITLFFAGLVALVQDDLKKVLAYSTVSQLGYMMAALGVGGYTAGIFHLFTHGFFKALLFLGAGSAIHAVHSNNMSDMGGLRKAMPHTFWTFIVGSVALAGFPLTAGFFSKDEVLVAGQYWPYATGNLVFWVGLAAAFVTAFYMARACFLVFFGESRSHHPPHESGKQMVAPLMVLAVLSIASGYIGSPVWDAENNFGTWTATPILAEADYPFIADDELAGDLQGGGEVLAGGAQGQATSTAVLAVEGEDAEGLGAGSILHGPPSWHLDVLLMALAVFLAAVALAWRIYGKGLPEEDPTFKMGPLTTVLVNKYGFDDAGYRYIVVPVRDHAARWASWSSNVVIDGIVAGAGRVTKDAAMTTYRVLDQKVIDGGVNGAAFSAAWWSERLKRIQSGDVQRYAAVLVAAVIVLVVVVAAAR
jgi:NADH-quinone oxidoreductase subunit L